MRVLQDDSDGRELDFPSRSISQSVLITSELREPVAPYQGKVEEADLNAKTGR